LRLKKDRRTEEQKIRGSMKTEEQKNKRFASFAVVTNCRMFFAKFAVKQHQYIALTQCNIWQILH